MRLLAIGTRLALAALFMMTLGLFGLPATTVNGSDTVRIEIDEGFIPADLTVQAGTTVEWRNKEKGTHTVTSDTGVFDSGPIPKGDEYLYTFTSAGTYHYSDQYSSYRGTVRVVGGSESPSPSGSTASPDTNPAVTVGDNNFQPRSLSVVAGTTVTWTNSGDKEHSVTGSGFNSGTLNPSRSFSFTFQQPGTFTYFCVFHSGQSGTINVTAASGQEETSPPPPPPPPGSSQVQVGDNFFSPAAVSVAAGSTVTWTNAGQMPHTVTGSGFDSGMLMPGQSFSYTFQSPGTVNYYCLYHGGQSGTITVGSSAAQGAPPPQPPPGSSQVQVGDNFFSPAAVSVAAGSTVTWTNSGQMPHTVTGSGFDSGMLMPGQSFSYTFQSPGTVNYYCLYHGGQSGTVTVGSSAAQGTLPPPPGPNQVHIGDDYFNPPLLSVAAGITITWTNTGSSPHTVTTTTFNSGMLRPGQSFSFTFAEAGVFAYYCIYHDDQDGVIEVRGSSLQATASGTSTATEENQIEIGDDFYAPLTISVSPGNTITWTNSGQRPHTVTGSGFDSGMLMPGQSFSYTFAQAGDFAYRCIFHDGQAGTINVNDDGSATTPDQTAGAAPTEAQPAPETSPAPPPETSHLIEVGDDFFAPATITVSRGNTVTWTNSGQRPHTVTGSGLDSGMLMPGQSFSYTFAQAGDFAYRCILHDGQAGTINVNDDGSAPAPDQTAGAAPPKTEPVPEASPEPATEPAHLIKVGDDFFAPVTISVSPGGTVTWTNAGQRPHTVTGSGFDSGMLLPGQSFSFTFSESGDFAYRCIYHPGQEGSVTVTSVTISSSAAVAMPHDQSPNKLVRTPDTSSVWPTIGLVSILLVAGAALVSSLASLLFPGKRNSET